jgi:hypothetical protein
MGLGDDDNADSIVAPTTPGSSLADLIEHLLVTLPDDVRWQDRHAFSGVR